MFLVCLWCNCKVLEFCLPSLSCFLEAVLRTGSLSVYDVLRCKVLKRKASLLWKFVFSWAIPIPAFVRWHLDVVNISNFCLYLRRQVFLFCFLPLLIHINLGSSVKGGNILGHFFPPLKQGRQLRWHFLPHVLQLLLRRLLGFFGCCTCNTVNKGNIKNKVTYNAAPVQIKSKKSLLINIKSIEMNFFIWHMGSRRYI